MKNNNKIKILNFKTRTFLGSLFLGLLFLIGSFSPNTVNAATYADKAKELCQTTKNNLSSTKNWEKDIVNGPTIGSIDNENIYIYISDNTTSSYTRDNQTFSIGDKKWIKVNSSCSSTIASKDVNVTSTMDDSTSETPATTETSTATTAPTDATDVAADDDSWKNDMPVNPTQQKADWLAVILSLIIGVLAITVPFNMMSEVTNAIKGAYNNLTKGTGKWIADKTGLTTQYKKGLFAVKDTKQGAWIAKTYRKYAGENNRAEEALKRQSEDIQGEVDTTIFLQSLAKVNGDANKLNAYYQDLAKRVLGDALGKSGDLAATNSAEQLFELIKSQNGIDFLKGINDGDGKAVSKAKDLSKITGGLGALTRQLHSSNPIEQAAAQNIISKLADETGLAPDEIIGMDFRTFKKGEVIARPDTPLAYMGPKPTKTDTPQTNIPLARKALQDSYHAGQEASISDMVRLEMGKRVENEGIISQNAANSLVEAIQKLVSEQGMTNEQAINLLQQEIQSANGLMEKGYRAQALSTFRKYGLPVSEFSGRPEEAKQVADQAKIFIEQAAANPRNLAAVKASYQTIVQNNKFDEETALLIKRETKMKIDARTVGAIRSGSATPELSERDRAFVSSAISRIGAPTAVNPEPEQTTPAQTRNEQYRQRDEAREQYPPETRPPTPGGGMPEI